MQTYGGALSLIFVLQSIFWWLHGFGEMLSLKNEAICWPFFLECGSVRMLDYKGNYILFFVLGFFSITNAFFFFYKKIKLAYFGLFFLELVSVLIILIDYRTHLNQNIMILFTIITFLFVRSKKQFIPIIIVSFYFWAGILKIYSPEWITGQAIYKSLWLIPDHLKAPAAIYAIFLECFLVWGLLSKNLKIQWIALIHLFIFHFVSTGAVGFYYPLLMLLILSIFYLPNTKHSPPEKLNLSISGVIILTIIIFVNLLPYFLPGDKALTGEARLFSLHMFDSIVYCKAEATIRRKNQDNEIINLAISSSIRIRCNPIIFISRMRSLCRENQNKPNFIDIDFSLKSKKISESEFHQVIDTKNFCETNPFYSIWKSNSWILKN